MKMIMGPEQEKTLPNQKVGVDSLWENSVYQYVQKHPQHRKCQLLIKKIF